MSKRKENKENKEKEEKEAELFKAIKDKDHKRVTELLVGGVDPHAEDEESVTALSYAIKDSSPEVVNALLKKEELSQTM